MKNLVMLIVVSAMAFSLASCGSSAPKATETALVTVAEIQQRPDAFLNQYVLVQGTLSFGGRKLINGDATLLTTNTNAKPDELYGEVPCYIIRQGEVTALVIVTALFRDEIQVKTGLVTVFGLWRQSPASPSFFYLQPLRVELRAQTAQDTPVKEGK